MRVVSQDGESKPESPLSLPARALLERALAEGAVTLLIAWETPTTFDRGTVPAADGFTSWARSLNSRGH
jgi:hypothetical protein